MDIAVPPGISQFLSEFGQASAVQIDIDGRFIGRRYPNEVNLIGDARATLQALLPKLHRKQVRSWRETIEKNVDSWWTSTRDETMVTAEPPNPMRIF